MHRLVFSLFFCAMAMNVGACEPDLITGGGSAADAAPQDEPDPTEEQIFILEDLNYLALGDSYTIGESVAASERWPTQLAAALTATGYEINTPDYIATTGWTTTQLLAAMEQQQPGADYELVSLLIGVNNQYQGKDFALYEKEFPELLSKAIALAGDRKERVFVVSIPDYGSTPFAQQRGLDAEKIAQELDRYNGFAEATCKAQGVAYYYITDITRASDPTLVASDGLHPSAKAYAKFVQVIAPRLENQLSQ